jgi:hypothetical protein
MDENLQDLLDSLPPIVFRKDWKKYGLPLSRSYLANLAASHEIPQEAKLKEFMVGNFLASRREDVVEWLSNWKGKKHAIESAKPKTISR